VLGKLSSGMQEIYVAKNKVHSVSPPLFNITYIM
jgi:hypothetical protein